jgi:hypothetical protein
MTQEIRWHTALIEWTPEGWETTVDSTLDHRTCIELKPELKRVLDRMDESGREASFDLSPAEQAGYNEATGELVHDADAAVGTLTILTGEILDPDGARQLRSLVDQVVSETLSKLDYAKANEAQQSRVFLRALAG